MKHAIKPFDKTGLAEEQCIHLRFPLVASLLRIVRLPYLIQLKLHNVNGFLCRHFLKSLHQNDPRSPYGDEFVPRPLIVSVVPSSPSLI